RHERSFTVSAMPVAERFMSRPAKTIRATVHASAIAVHRMIESHVGTVVAADDRARFGLFKDFDLSGGWLTDPFNGMRQPGIRWIVDVAHLCNRVLSMQQSIAEGGGFWRMKVRVRGQ